MPDVRRFRQERPRLRAALEWLLISTIIGAWIYLIIWIVAGR